VAVTDVNGTTPNPQHLSGNTDGIFSIDDSGWVRIADEGRAAKHRDSELHPDDPR